MLRAHQPAARQLPRGSPAPSQLLAAFFCVYSSVVEESEESTVGALPKKRHTNARQGNRRAHHKVKLPQLTICPQCRQPRQSHHACPNCGSYRGRQVLKAKNAAAE
jgi:large subunit ribosomal protein L32